jgi:hypothetical protein
MVTVGTRACALAAEADAAAAPVDAPLTDGIAIDGTDGIEGADTDALDTDGVLSVGLLMVGMLGKSGTAL